MAAFDLEEQERVDALKDWWKQNRLFVYVALAAFVIAVGGVQGWRYYKAARADQAAESFAQFETTAEARDVKKTGAAARKLMEQYPDSPYATQAALTAARQSFEAGDRDAAQADLRWAVDKAKSAQMQNIARLRLAAVLLDQKKYDEALKLLDDNKDPAFLSLTADMKGDLYAAQGKLAEARSSYTLAIEKALVNSPSRQLMQIKLDMLGDAK